MSNLAAARKQFAHLNDYTDQELLGFVAQQNNLAPDSPGYKRLEQELLGYNRTAGGAVKDAVVGIGQGLTSVVQSVAVAAGNKMAGQGEMIDAVGQRFGLKLNAAARVNALNKYDNPLVNGAAAARDWMEQFKSEGLRNQEAGSALAVDIAGAEAKRRGDGTMGTIASQAQAKLGSYADTPALAVQDVIANLPQMIGPAVAGRAAQAGALASGLSAKVAGRFGLGAGVAAGGFMQGTDIGRDTYQRAIKEGATPEVAAQLADEAALKAGAATVGLSLTPLGGTIERSLLRGAASSTVGRGLGGRVLSGVGEAVSEGLEEGYGQFAGNQGVKQVNPNTDLAMGVGSAAVQGAVAGGPMGAIMAHPGAKRTESGEIDLVAPPNLRTPAPLDEPAYQRRGLDPLNERSSPWAPGDPGIPTLTDVVTPDAPQNVMMVTPDGTVLPAQTPEQMARLDEMRRFNEGIPTLTDELAPADGIPVLNEQVDVPAIPTLTDQLAPADGIPVLTEEVANPARPNRGALLTTLQAANKELGKSVVKKDGELAGNRAAAPLREVMESKDPLATLRALHQDGNNTRDELLDVWHQKLTGQTVFEWRAAEQAQTAAAVATPAEVTPAQISPPVALEAAAMAADAVAEPAAAVAEPAIAAVDPAAAVAEPAAAVATPVQVAEPVVPAAPVQVADPTTAPAAVVDLAPVETPPKKSKAPKYGRHSTEELIEISDNTKDQTEFEQSRYELYKRWAEGDEKASEYMVEGRDISTAKGLNKFLARPEIKAFKLRHDAELAAKATKQAQKLGKKFAAAFRTTDDGAKGMSTKQAKSVSDSVTRGWKNAPPVEVVAGLDELPADLRAQAEQDGVSPKAAYHEGKVWIIASSHNGTGDVVASVLHEIAGHHGLRGVLNDQFDATMRQIYTGNPEVRKAADAMAKAEGLSAELAVEEVLSDMAEKGTVEPSLLDRIANTVRQVMRRIGLGRFASDFSNAEVLALLRSSRRFVEDGEGAAPASSQAVYRGSALTQPLADAARAVQADVQAQITGAEISPKLLSIMTLRQIAEQFGTKLPAMRGWIDAIMQRSSNAAKLAAEADRVALQWEQSVKDPAERSALAEVLLRASVAELELDNVTQKYLDTLSPAQRTEHAALRTKLQALSADSQRTRTQALAILRRQWEYTRDSLESFINHTVADPGLRNERIEQMKQELGRNRGDYFPLSRFGDRVVIGHGAASDGRDVVSFHETAASADEAVAKHKAAGRKVTINLKTVHDSRERASTGFMGEMHSMIDGSEADSAVKDSMHEALQQLFIKSMPELSGAKAMIRRENVEGFSRDALRVFADAVTRGSRYASQLEYAPMIQAAREAAEAQSRSSDTRSAAVVIGRKDGEAPRVMVTQVGTDRLNAVNRLEAEGYATQFFNTIPESAAERLAGALEGETQEKIAAYAKDVELAVGRSSEGVEDMRAAKALYNHMVKLQQSEANEDPSAVVQALGQMGYVWYLGLSPAFWAINTLQNPMIGIPHLASKYGVGKASAEWGGAMKWFAGVRIGKAMKDGKTPFSVEWLKDAVTAGTLTGITKEELAMLQTLEDRQVLDFTQSMDLSRIGQASSAGRYKFMRFAAAGAHHTEVFNRVTFALAAYRLAIKSDGNVSHDEAVRRAENDTAAVHFDYSYANKPALMRGKVSRLMFMFQQYRQHMLYWWINNVKDMVKDEAPGDRQRALKAALLMGTTQGIFAGAMGLPFIGSVAFLANLLAGDDDDGAPFDFNRWILEAAKDQVGEKAGEVMAKGIFAALGMNISARVGQADLMPLLNQSGSARYERTTDDKIRAFAYDLAGPLGSVALNAGRALDAFERGDTMAGLAAVTPKFVSDLLKASDMGSEGLKNSRGEQLATAEAFDGWDVAMQAAGVVPTAAANIKADGAKVRSVEAAIDKRTRELTGQFVESWARGDREGMAEVMTSIQKFNAGMVEKYHDKSVLIDRRQLESAIKDHQNRALMLALSSGTAETKRQLMLAKRTSGLFNQVTDQTVQQNAGNLPGLPGLPGLAGR